MWPYGNYLYFFNGAIVNVVKEKNKKSPTYGTTKNKILNVFGIFNQKQHIINY